MLRRGRIVEALAGRPITPALIWHIISDYDKLVHANLARLKCCRYVVVTDPKDNYDTWDRVIYTENVHSSVQKPGEAVAALLVDADRIAVMSAEVCRAWFDFFFLFMDVDKMRSEAGKSVNHPQLSQRDRQVLAVMENRKANLQQNHVQFSDAGLAERQARLDNYYCGPRL